LSLEISELTTFNQKGFRMTYKDMGKLQNSIFDTLTDFMDIMGQDKYQKLYSLALTIDEDKSIEHNYSTTKKIENEILLIWEGDWFGF